MPNESASGFIDDSQNRSPFAQLESGIKRSGSIGDSCFFGLGAIVAHVPEVQADSGKSGGFQSRYPADL
jgi:hypothetical protein